MRLDAAGSLLCMAALKNKGGLYLLVQVPTTSWCKGCKQTLGADDFYRLPGIKSGLAPRCKACTLELARAATASRRQLGRRRHAAQPPTKLCAECGRFRALEAFPRDPRSSAGRRRICKACAAAAKSAG